MVITMWMKMRMMKMVMLRRWRRMTRRQKPKEDYRKQNKKYKQILYKQ